jgi:serine/threonine protein phosphatase PrpC
VLGELAVSRAIGDFKYKGSGGAEEEHAVTCLPSITRFTLSDKDKCIVLVSDGIVDGMDVETLAAALMRNPLEQCLVEIINIAHVQSRDNTVILHLEIAS